MRDLIPCSVNKKSEDGGRFDSSNEHLDDIGIEVAHTVITKDPGLGRDGIHCVLDIKRLGEKMGNTVINGTTKKPFDDDGFHSDGTYVDEIGRENAHTITTHPTDLAHNNENVVLDIAVVQKCGDRDKEGNYSVHDYSNTIPANAMSDRGQMIVESQDVTDKIIKIGTLSPTSHLRNGVYDDGGIVPTLLAGSGGGGGNIPLVVDKEVIRMVRTDEGKQLRKAYEAGEIHHGFNEHREAEPRKDGCSNTITTVQKDNLLLESAQLPECLGGIGEKKSNGGRQYYQQDRVYDGEGIALTIPAQLPGGSNIYLFCDLLDDGNLICRMVGRDPEHPTARVKGAPTEQMLEPRLDGNCGTLTTVQKDNIVLEQSIAAMRTRDTNGGWTKGGDGHEQNLEVNNEGVCNNLTSVQKDNLVVETKFSYGDEQDIERLVNAQEGIHNCKLNKMPEGELASYDEAHVCDIDHPLGSTVTARYHKGIGAHKDNMVMEKIQTDELNKWVWEIDGVYYLIRIRKLTPNECWRLMDFTDEDFHKAEAVNSNTQLYKQAGNSIVKSVLTNVFAQLF